MPELLVQLLLVPLLVQSIGGYTWLAAHLRRTHGAVRPDALGFADLMVFLVLGFLMLQLSVVALMKKAPMSPAFDPTPVQILVSPLLPLILSCAIVGFMIVRNVSVVELLGLRRLPLGRVACWALPLVFLAIPTITCATAGVLELLKRYGAKGLTDEQVLVALFRSDVQHGHYLRLVSVFVSTVILAPLGEELLFRGYFYPVGKRYFGATGSAMATAVLFAFLHLNAASFAGLFVLALCLTLAFEYTGSLLVPIAMHATFNASSLAWLVYDVMQKHP